MHMRLHRNVANSCDTIPQSHTICDCYAQPNSDSHANAYANPTAHAGAPLGNHGPLV